MDFVMVVLAHYGLELDRAQAVVSAGSLHDWSNIDKQVNLDELTGAVLYSVSLTKINGEILYLEATPDSLLNLSTHLISMLAVPANASLFSAMRISLFMAELPPVLELLQPESEPDSDNLSVSDTSSI
jgi:hypothetical protein